MTLSVEEIARLLRPYFAEEMPAEKVAKIERYLQVFAVWGQRMNLSTVTEPAQVVQRHFGEGLALAEALPPFATLLDLGSGAGFPGLPIALSRPAGRVTLAESQKKKAAFLVEAAWQMGLPVEVWADRAEKLVPLRCFDVVTLRAVDGMQDALRTARALLRPGGTLAFFEGECERMELPGKGWGQVRRTQVPNSLGNLVFATLER